MSRETLGGGGVSPAPASGAADLDLAERDASPEGGTAGVGAPAAPRERAAPRHVEVLRTALVALLVAVLAGAFATVVEQRRDRAGAADRVHLLGAFAPGGAGGVPSADVGTASVSGLLNVVNAGADPVELTAATVAGAEAERMRPRLVRPGEAVQLHTTVDLPCAPPGDDRVRVTVRVVPADGPPGPKQQETLDELPLITVFPLREYVTSICAGDQELARVTSMQIDADGTVVAELRSVSPHDVRVRVLLAPRMGAVLNGGAAVEAVVPPEGVASLRLTIAIEDCERARQSVGVDYEVLVVQAGVGQPGAMGYLDGWQSSVGVAAFGFALARDC